MSKTKSNLFDTDLKATKALITLTSLRGGHGMGLMGVKVPKSTEVNKEIEASWVKIGNNFHAALQTTEFKTFLKTFENPWALFGHDRYATRGSVCTANTHPFAYKDIILLHNGSVWNGLDLKKDQTDSERITELIAEQGAKKTLEHLDGAFVCVWYDGKDNTVNIAKNDKRPLFYMEDNFVRIFASEELTLEFIRKRELTGKTEQSMPIKAVPNMVWMKFNPITGEVGETELKKYIPPIQKTSYQATTYINDKYKSQYPHTSGYGGVGNSSYSPTVNNLFNPDNKIKGKNVRFYFDRAHQDGNIRDNTMLYKGETFNDEHVADGFPIMFRSNKPDDFKDLFNKMCIGNVVGFDKIGKNCYILLKTSSIVMDEAEEEETSTLLVLKDGSTMTEEAFIEALPHRCYYCGTRINLDEADFCTTKDLGHAKRLICPTCTETAIFTKQTMDDLSKTNINGMMQ